MIKTEEQAIEMGYTFVSEQVLGDSQVRRSFFNTKTKLRVDFYHVGFVLDTVEDEMDKVLDEVKKSLKKAFSDELEIIKDYPMTRDEKRKMILDIFEETETFFNFE